MKKLIRVVRSSYTPEFVPDNPNTAGAWRRRLPLVVLTRELTDGQSNFTREGEFFIIEQDDIETAMRTFAESNPGCEVQVYALEASAQCPAAAMVVKKVSTDGVLPG